MHKHIKTHSQPVSFSEIMAKSSVGSRVNTDRCTFPAHKFVTVFLCVFVIID